MKDQISEQWLYISASERVMKLILSTHVLLVFINTICKYSQARMILHNVGEVYIPDHGIISEL